MLYQAVFISALMRPHSRMSTMDVFCLEAVYTFYFKKYQHCQYLPWVIKSLLNKTRDKFHEFYLEMKTRL